MADSIRVPVALDTPGSSSRHFHDHVLAEAKSEDLEEDRE